MLVVKLRPGESVTSVELGDRMALVAPQFERLSDAFLADLETRFV
jgi:hypothetical protein